MKGIYTLLKQVVNKVISSLSSLTNFSRPKIHRDIVCAYGTPSASYSFKGKVTNEEGMPIEGVTVEVSGTNTFRNTGHNEKITSVQTESNGNYSVNISDHPLDPITLTFSHQGFVTGEASFADKDLEFKERKGWYKGEARVELNMTLKNEGNGNESNT
ncbi:MAG: radical SAM-associated putative lipoprotein [Paludibacteraceae bacterium]|nr:radical SAM-associated putative lipoprotein [Paludibacteraceae bacterium]